MLLYHLCKKIFAADGIWFYHKSSLYWYLDCCCFSLYGIAGFQYPEVDNCWRFWDSIAYTCWSWGTTTHSADRITLCYCANSNHNLLQIFTNFLSSVMINATRPFVVNEWINAKIDGVEFSGIVEVSIIMPYLSFQSIV